ncbi:MAG: hypothetical protein ACP5O6_08310 [Candidatus Baltobacteraceae bacterium]
MNDEIEVYSAWNAAEPPKQLGVLRVRPGRTGELFDFTFDSDVLSATPLLKYRLDPSGIFYRSARCLLPIDGPSVEHAG